MCAIIQLSNFFKEDMSEIDDLRLAPIHGDGLPVSNIVAYSDGTVTYEYSDNEVLVVDVKQETACIYDKNDDSRRYNVKQLTEESEVLQHASKSFNDIFRMIGTSRC
jgi:hypothetical protein